MDALLALASPAYLAARLALLALRASISHDLPLKADLVVLAPATNAISTDSAANLLVAMDKPRFCRAETLDSTLVVSCGPLPSEEREWYAVTREDDAQRGGFMGYLEETHGRSDHLVAAFGRDESLLLPMSAVDLWHRDYEIRGVGHVGDDITNPYKSSDSQYRDAERRGAVGILQFWSSADDHGTVTSQVMEFPLSPTASVEERQRVEDGLIQMARMSREMLLVLDSPGTARDSGQTKTKWRQWQESSLQKQREHWKTMAQLMEEFFHGRTMPPDVAAFIAECRKRCD